MKKAFLIITFLIAKVAFSQSYEEDQYPEAHFEEWQKMNQSKQESKVWFKDAKFGLFIHWGLYSIPAGIWKGKKIHEMRPPHVAEWIMHAAEIPRNEYAQLSKQFDPTEFNADSIAKLAKDAGMKYVVITSKHHDGFALFDSKVSTYDVMDATPFKRDIIKELHAACKKQGLDFGVYYSHQVDWYDGSDSQSALFSTRNPSASKQEKTFGANLWDPSPNSFEDYLKTKAIPQIKELMNQYPDMKLLWYDMPYRMNAEQSYDFYKTVYDIQPQIIINERIGNGFGDFNITGDNTIPIHFEHLEKPWETVGTFNNSWGYNSYDNDWKSPDEVLYWLVEIVSKGGNYMLNIGPTGEGVVPKESVKSLQELGKWLSVNGDAIYGTQRWKITREGPTNLNFKSTEDRAEKGFKNVFTSNDFWFTKKEKKLYVISFKYPESFILIKNLTRKNVGEIKTLKMLGSESKLQWEQTTDGLRVELPKMQPNSYGYALEINL